MKTAPTHDAALTADRAFVVQFRSGSNHAGRVEHVTSSEATHFESLDELLRFMALRLRAPRRAREHR